MPEREVSTTLKTVGISMSVRSFLCIALATSFIGAAANAQTPHYRGAAITGDSVTVDLSVLDRLGPPPSLPQLLRPGSVTPQLLTPPSALPELDPTARLQQPPAGAPKSGLNVPSVRGEIAAPKRPAPATVRTPPPAAKKPPPQVAKKPAPPAAEQPPAPKQAPAPVAKKPPAPAPKAAEVKPKPPAPKQPPARQQTAARAAAPKPAETAKPAAPKQPAATTKPAAPKQAPEPAKPAAQTAAKPSGKSQAAPAAEKPPEPKPAEQAKPAPVKQVAAVPGEAIERDGSVTVTFAPGSSDLPDNAVGALDRLAERLKADPNLRIQLVGFARTQVESASQARRLSLFRALSVRTHLMKKGVRSTRMDVRALGNKEDDGPPDRVDLVVPSGS